MISLRLARFLSPALAVVTLGSSAARGQCMNWNDAFSHNFFSPSVRALVSFDDGTGPALYAGVEWGGVVKWDGSGWSLVGMANGEVFALAVYDDGTGPALFVGGFFSSIAGVSASAIAKWDGSSWSEVGGGVYHVNFNPYVLSLYVWDDGGGPALYVGGRFKWAGLVHSERIAKWDGANWSSLAGGVDIGNTEGSVFSIAGYDDGGGPDLYVGGTFTTAGSITTQGIARWDGLRWSAVGNVVDGGAASLAVFDDGTGSAMYAGGGIRPSGMPVQYIARWNGSAWSSVGGNLSGAPDALLVFDDGSGPALYAGGGFTLAGTTPVHHIARWNGLTWSSPGGGVDSDVINPYVYALAAHDDGSGSGPNLFLGGSFTRAGAIPSYQIAEWRRCPGPIDSFCFGDGTVAACPCGNQGTSGRGCQNSAATGGALLQSAGTTVPDTLVLTSSGELPSALSIFLQGNALISAGTADFGDGLRCAGGSLKRLFVKSASAGTVTAPESGDPSITARSAQLGDPITPGSTRYYQIYYRDPDPSFCASPSGNTFNASNGLRVVW